MKKIEVFRKEDYTGNEEKYADYDIVYSASRNLGGHHNFYIWKAPEGIDKYDLAKEIDGFFFEVYKYSNVLMCYYD